MPSTDTDFAFLGISDPLDAPFYESSPIAAGDVVPWELPVSINDHAYMIEFPKSRVTSMQVRRQSADDSVEPGEQTLSVAGVWPRAQDNWFLGAGQEDLDNRFAFQSVYVHSGEYPSIRTRFLDSLGIDPWSQGKLSLHLEYDTTTTSVNEMHIVGCGSYLYASDGANLSYTVAPVVAGVSTWTTVTTTNTQVITSMTSDGYQVWLACGTDGVFSTVGGSGTVAAAATPPALTSPQGVIVTAQAAGTTNTTNLPAGSTTDYYVSAVDAFGNETAATHVVAPPSATPNSLSWSPNTDVSAFIVRRKIAAGVDAIISSDTPPAYVDDGSIDNTNVSPHPTSNGTGTSAYPASFVAYAKGHLIGSKGRDLVEILADGSTNFIFQHVSPGFVFTCAADTPTAIIVGGYAGEYSFIGALQPDAANNGATLAPPTWATTLPVGEKIQALLYTTGVMTLATSLGVRQGSRPDASGSFDVAAVITAPGSVSCLASYGRFAYFGWTNFNTARSWRPNGLTYSGLGRLDLSQTTEVGINAYATDVMNEGNAGDGGTATGVAVVDGVPYFVVNAAGLRTCYAPTGKYSESGWLEVGWVRYGTLEKKILVEMDMQHKPLPGTASVDYAVVAEDEAIMHDIYTQTLPGATTVVDPISLGLKVGDRFMPVITLNATAMQDDTPVFLSHITKAMVVTKRQDEVLLALIFREDVETLGPANKKIWFDLWYEFQYLKQLESTGEVVTLRIGSYVHSAYIDQVMTEPEDITAQRTWFQGYCTVKLITLD